MTDRQKAGVAFWATVAVVVVTVAYPLSFGPAYWLLNHTELPAPLVSALVIFYLPITWLINSPWFINSNGLTWLGQTMQWYLAFWV